MLTHTHTQNPAGESPWRLHNGFSYLDMGGVCVRGSVPHLSVGESGGAQSWPVAGFNLVVEIGLRAIQHTHTQQGLRYVSLCCAPPRSFPLESIQLGPDQYKRFLSFSYYSLSLLPVSLGAGTNLIYIRSSVAVAIGCLLFCLNVEWVGEKINKTN